MKPSADEIKKENQKKETVLFNGEKLKQKQGFRQSCEMKLSAFPLRLQMLSCTLEPYSDQRHTVRHTSVLGLRATMLHLPKSAVSDIPLSW